VYLFYPISVKHRRSKPKQYNTFAPDNFRMKKSDLIIDGINPELTEFIGQYIDLDTTSLDTRTIFVKTPILFNIRSLKENIRLDGYNSVNLVNLSRINNVPRINKFFNTVNDLLPINGLYVGCVETYNLRHKRIHQKYPPVISQIYFLLDFTFKRIFPKLKFTKRIYFFITAGRNRAISKAETLGRVISCGFEILDDRIIDGFLYFVVKKTGEPLHDDSPSYGPLYKMQRVGKNGKMIGVYKFRTMHPYSEYLQDYVIKKSGYNEIGKPADDFRLTSWGGTMRKFWLDEIPQLINVLKGEMKLVGIRPVSKRFLKEYPPDMVELRLKHKPGCVPPYVALLKQEVSEYIESERTYLKEKEANPYTTDWKYFFKAVYNILSNKIRSS